MMKQTILLLLLSVLLYGNIKAQGCVAIRSTSNPCSQFLNQEKASSKHWVFTINNRYYRSFRHFVGDKEQKQRATAGTQVINYSYTADLTLLHSFNNRWSAMVNLPVAANTRSSLYEHDGKHRHSTKSFGLGDLRIAVYNWILDPARDHKGNIQWGVGLKFPTGDYKYQDQFFSNDSTKVLGPVDQSIQLGDGGTGLTAELSGYYNFSHRLKLYGNFYYLANPREQNGVSTARGRTPNATSIANGSDIMSVPDQYMIRMGLNYEVKKFIFSAGLRNECLPVYDLIGGSNGFRRPGYIISAEPGVSYSSKNITIYTMLPFALKRNRSQSVPDKIRTKLTGVYTQGDAAFADHTFNVGCAIKF